jgi:hypothetical protein
MPDRGRYSHRFRFDLAEPLNESIPHSDAFYTLNVLLGLSQLPTVDGFEYLDVEDAYERCCADLSSPKARLYALGMALWSGARLGIEPPGPLIDRIREILASPRALHRASAQDIGMLVSGAAAMSTREGERWRPAAEALIDHLRKRYYEPASHLFYNESIGYRRRFSSFASQVYSMLALYQFGEAFDQDWPVALANQSAARVIARQGPRGEWGWFYFVPHGQTIDFYEIYSVHQHGMAPAFLHHAVEHGVSGAKDALVRGFLWLFRNNEMGVSMLHPKEPLFYRSQVRRGELDSNRRRVFRSIRNAVAGRQDSVGNHHGLVLRQECRSYELGWILWSFGARSDYTELTGRAEFAA